MPPATLVHDTPELSRRERRLLVLLITGLHVAGLWALLQVDSVRAAVREVAPLFVDLVAPPAPEPPRPPPPPPARPRPPLPPPPRPLLAAPELPAVPAPAFTAPAPPPEPWVAAPALPPEAPVAATPAPPAPAPAPQRKQVPPTAVRYRVLPPVEVPRASRRAGESGTVWLRVVVSVHGLPVQIHLQRSSGHARLDEQAMWAMRQARFEPQTEDGQPIELEVTAPIEYPLE